jgi:CRP/FNR family transcriptional regulator, cyclic AMP receptor protein
MAQEDQDIDRAFVAQVPIFAGLPDRVIAILADSLRILRVVPGAQVLREGEHARSMFVVLDGELEILKHSRHGAEHKLAVLKRGDCVGEMSLIDIRPRSATARAIGPATLYVLEQSQIAKVSQTDIEAYALLVLNIAREISRRLRCADDAMVDMGFTATGMWSDAALAAGKGNVAEPAAG